MNPMPTRSPRPRLIVPPVVDVHEPRQLDTWRRAFAVLLLGAAVTAVMDRLLFSGAERVGNLRGLHLTWSVAVTLAAAAAVRLLWPRTSRDLEHLPEPELLRAQRRLLAHAFSRSIAHDGNNILLGLRFRSAELARLQQERVQGREVSEAEMAALVHELGQSCDEVEVLLGRLRELGQQTGRIAISSIELDEILPRVVDFASGHAAVRIAAPELQVEAGLRVQADPTLLRQLLTNLLLNAAEACGRDARVKLCARRGLEHVLLEVHDNGPGLPESEGQCAPDIRPFHSGRPDGTGLGLWAARAAAEAMDGRIQFSRSDLGGLCVRVMLPEGRAVAG